MAIENSSSDFGPRSSIVMSVLDYHLSGMNTPIRVSVLDVKPKKTKSQNNACLSVSSFLAKDYHVQLYNMGQLMRFKYLSHVF